MTPVILGVRNYAAGLRQVVWLAAVLRERVPDARIVTNPVGAGRQPQRDGEPHLPCGDADEVLACVASGECDAALVDMRECSHPRPEDIEVVAFTARRNPRYAFLHKLGTALAKAPKGERVFTACPLAQAQVGHVRPDLVWTPLSGDLPTRLHKLHLKRVDAIVEPAADLLALGFDERAFEFLSTDVALPSPGQGAWAVCARSDRRDIADLFAPLDDPKTRLCVETEREALAAIRPPADIPLATWARVQSRKLVIDAALCPPGDAPTRLSISGPPEHRRELVAALAGMFRHGAAGPARRQPELARR